jgi:Protein of unknown function (DUF1501)
MNRSAFFRDYTRRDVLKCALASAFGVSFSGWLPRLARAAEDQHRRRACILLWMNGGPTQTDTFDLKPGHKNGGPFQPIETAVPGIRISEHLPGVARQMQDLAIIRSMTSREGDHGRATELMLTGYRPTGGSVRYPVLGSLIAKELGRRDSELPSFVSISPFRFANLGSGFLGPQYAPLTVSGQSDDPTARANLSIENLAPPAHVTGGSLESRFGLLKMLQDQFGAEHAFDSVESHAANYERAMRMVRTQAKSAFKLDEEDPALRDAYGRNRFGQGCLLARRLVERGVAFVEVTLAQIPGNEIGWDTHVDNFARVQRMCEVLDPAWSTLMDDLRRRGRLESTLVVWMGEFGRTPVINDNGGRDHFPAAWSTVLAGGGIRGGQVVGATDAGGDQVAERPVTVPEFYATICAALGIDPDTENISDGGRPIGIVDAHAQPIAELIRAQSA